MKIFQSTFFLFVGLGSIFSCSPDPEGMPVIKGTNVEGDELMLSEIASSIKEIPLQTRDDVFVQSVSSITKSDEHIYMLDLDRIIKFRLDGSYAGELAKRCGTGGIPGGSGDQL